jgi:uncharacterized protein (TIGR02217 family)
MPFYEQLFPPEISANMVGGPRFTAMQAGTIGGQRFTNLMDPYPLHEYSFEQPPRTGEEFEALRAFFWVVRGIDGFRFKDWSDHRLTLQNSNLTLISGTTWQINRLYQSPGRTAVRPIYKPAPGVKVFRTRSGTTTDITGSSTITTTDGRVVIAGHAGGDTYALMGQFHVPVAFTSPQAAFAVLGGSAMLTSWSDISILETRQEA